MVLCHFCLHKTSFFFFLRKGFHKTSCYYNPVFQTTVSALWFRLHHFTLHRGKRTFPFSCLSVDVFYPLSMFSALVLYGVFLALLLCTLNNFSFGGVWSFYKSKVWPKNNLVYISNLTLNKVIDASGWLNTCWSRLIKDYGIAFK